AVAPLSGARCGFALVAETPSSAGGSALLALGGRRGPEKLATVERYDLLLGTWQTLPCLPSPRDGLAAAVARGKVYVFGGRGVGQTLALAECFDPQTGVWTALPQMPHASCGLAAAVAER
ncbi:unnamed protein product, partial [Effrenium voratum]